MLTGGVANSGNAKGEGGEGHADHEPQAKDQIDEAKFLDCLHRPRSIPKRAAGSMRLAASGSAAGFDFSSGIVDGTLDRTAEQECSTGNASANHGEDQGIFGRRSAGFVTHEITNESHVKSPVDFVEVRHPLTARSVSPLPRAVNNHLTAN